MPCPVYGSIVCICVLGLAPPTSLPPFALSGSCSLVLALAGRCGGRGTWNYVEGNGIGNYVICTVEYWYQHRQGVGVYVYIIGSFSLMALDYLLMQHIYMRGTLPAGTPAAGWDGLLQGLRAT